MPLKHREKLRARWTKVIPALDDEYALWWLDGDGGLLTVTSDLTELLDTIEEHYPGNLTQTVRRARYNSAGDLVADEKRDFVVVKLEQDSAFGWNNET